MGPGAGAGCRLESRVLHSTLVGVGLFQTIPLAHLDPPGLLGHHRPELVAAAGGGLWTGVEAERAAQHQRPPLHHPGKQHAAGGWCFFWTGCRRWCAFSSAAPLSSRPPSGGTKKQTRKPSSSDVTSPALPVCCLWWTGQWAWRPCRTARVHPLKKKTVLHLPTVRGGGQTCAGGGEGGGGLFLTHGGGRTTDTPPLWTTRYPFTPPGGCPPRLTRRHTRGLATQLSHGA